MRCGEAVTAFGESTLAAARKQVGRLRCDLRTLVDAATLTPEQWRSMVAALERVDVIASNLDQVAELERGT